jgi:hypothetical protein
VGAAVVRTVSAVTNLPGRCCRDCHHQQRQSS